MRVFVAIACTIAVAGSAHVSAQGKGAGPKVKTSVPVTHGGGSTHGKSATYKPTSAGRPTTTKPAAAHGGSTKATATTVAKGGGHTRTTDAKATGNGKAARTATTSTTTPTTTSTTTTTTTDTTGTTATTQTPLTPVQQKLQKNTNLASKLQSRLPAGTDVTKAAAGFRNLGQFVAAVNVSNNLDLNFTTLKTAMVTDGKSLGQAIQAQKGTTVNASTEATRAQTDADTLIRSTETTGRKQKPARSGRS
jgi:hypothetical protein